MTDWDDCGWQDGDDVHYRRAGIAIICASAILTVTLIAVLIAWARGILP